MSARRPTPPDAGPAVGPTPDLGAGWRAVLALYGGAMGLAAPLVLGLRRARGKEDPARLAERLGRADRPRPAGPLVWLHAASVGEAKSLLPLIETLAARTPAPALLLTTGTVTSARAVAAVLPPGACHQFAPLDATGPMRRFLAHWRPDLSIRVESEVWPLMTLMPARAGVPMMLVNGRLSARSAARWARLPGLARALFGAFAHVHVQDGETAARLARLGVDPGVVSADGNLKTLLPPPGCDETERAALAARLAGRPVWLAASTHAGEEDAVLAAHRALAGRWPRLLTILAPRHPERAEAVTRLAGDLPLVRRSAGAPPPDAAGVWLADTMGEMGLWYRLAPVSLVAGSLAPRGGHNPFEPAALGSAILHGPDTRNFAPAYAALSAVGAARAVADGAELGAALAALLGPDGQRTAEAEAMCRAAPAALAPLKPDVLAMADRALALMAPSPSAPVPTRPSAPGAPAAPAA
ncbi:MAG: 3-deoxy-D-manno-octulosonic acid transferase, partial [Pseudomonadota bacterium]